MKDSLVSQAAAAAEHLGFSGVVPDVLSDQGNLIVRLAPYPIAARVAKLLPGKDAELLRETLARELRAAVHLQKNGVPVIRPAAEHAGPHPVSGTWMTWWEYMPAAQLEPIAAAQAVELVQALSSAMASFPEPLPMLGVWETARQSAQRLKTYDDPRMKETARAFFKADERLRQMSPVSFIPAHGDAHARNLHPAADGWRWMDFENVSLMPRYWDLASYVGNAVLFGGFAEPALQYMLTRPGIVTDRRAFAFALSARILLATVSNLDLALQGHGDLAFAHRQLGLCCEFIIEADKQIR